MPRNSFFFHEKTPFLFGYTADFATIFQKKTAFSRRFWPHLLAKYLDLPKKLICFPTQFGGLLCLGFLWFGYRGLLGRRLIGSWFLDVLLR